MKSPLSIVILALSVIVAPSWAGDPEFGGHCTMAMTKGEAVQTSCAVFWLSPDEKVYCFHSTAARDEFVKAPVANLQKAKEFWEDPAFWERFNRQR